MELKQEKFLDLRGLTCPLPLLKTQVQLKKMYRGEELIIYLTDPQAYDDLNALASANVINLIEFIQHDQYFQVRLERT